MNTIPCKGGHFENGTNFLVTSVGCIDEHGSILTLSLNLRLETQLL